MSGEDGGNDGGDEGPRWSSSGESDPARERVPAQEKAGDQVRELPGRFPEEGGREGRAGVAERRRHPRGATSAGEKEDGLGELGAVLGEVQRR